MICEICGSDKADNHIVKSINISSEITEIEHYCDNCYINYIEGKVFKNLNFLNLNNKSKVVLAVSGEKDSIMLLHLYSKYLNIKKVKINTVVLFVNVKIAQKYPKIRDFNSLQISFSDYYNKSINNIIEETENKEKKSFLLKTPCALCTELRGRIFSKFAQINKIDYFLTGTNFDDLLYDALLQLITPPYQIKSETFSLSNFIGGTSLCFSPLATIKNDEVQKYLQIKGIEYSKKQCQYEVVMPRRKIDTFINTGTDNIFEFKNRLFEGLRQVSSRFENTNRKKGIELCVCGAYKTQQTRLCRFCKVKNFFNFKIEEDEKRLKFNNWR
jgi:tRNA(Ile)-lysidine synthase TilS/MesJ